MTLGAAIGEIVQPEKDMNQIIIYFGYLFAQGCVFLILLILIDYWRTVYYKGQDNGQNNIQERL